jgi:hypothetical protein
MRPRWGWQVKRAGRKRVFGAAARAMGRGPRVGAGREPCFKPEVQGRPFGRFPTTTTTTVGRGSRSAVRVGREAGRQRSSHAPAPCRPTARAARARRASAVAQCGREVRMWELTSIAENHTRQIIKVEWKKEEVERSCCRRLHTMPSAAQNPERGVRRPPLGGRPQRRRRWGGRQPPEDVLAGPGQRREGAVSPPRRRTVPGGT